ncbi:uncharacterized protein BROUX77_006929 [Berkeleyomyces rouxiae]|uniref:uncharacterized protein n=1 Tax=Berkeleyomyces rouxiae TaxID=2035830 RepID=UPI003B80FCA1
MFRKYTTAAAILASKAALAADDSVQYIGCYPAVTSIETRTIYASNSVAGSETTTTGTNTAAVGVPVTVTETKYETKVETQVQTLTETVFVSRDSEVAPSSLFTSAVASSGLFTSSPAATTALLSSSVATPIISTVTSAVPSEATGAEFFALPSSDSPAGSSEDPDTTTTIKTTSTKFITIPYPSSSSMMGGGLNYNATSTFLVGTASTLSTQTALRTPIASASGNLTVSYGVETTGTGTATAIATPTKTSSASNSSSTSIINGRSNAIYFTNWGIYGANYQPDQLPGDKITRVLYSFADISSDGTVISSDPYADLEKHYTGDSWNESGTNAYGCIKQLYLQKKKYRHMKLLLSIGGWTYSSKFAPAVGTAAGRTKFCSSALALVKDWGFDGIDIDWEYPKSTNETQNYLDLVKECREQFDEYAAEYADNYHFQITIASPAGPSNITHLNLPEMDKYVDAWHLMAYDYAGAWDETSGHQANIYKSKSNPESTKFSTDTAINLYLNHSISADKLVLGFPLYGRSFIGTDGPGKPYTGLGKGSLEEGIWLYKDLPRSGATEHYDADILATWSYDNATREMVSYDNVKSAQEKTKWMVDNGLGGAVYWEASGDKNGTDSIVASVADAMGDMDTSENLLSYPESVYENIRNNMEESDSDE